MISGVYRFDDTCNVYLIKKGTEAIVFDFGAGAWNGKALAFCGDAVHAGGTIYQPYHLEWAHWTAEGSLEA